MTCLLPRCFASAALLHWNDAAAKLTVSGDASPAGDPTMLVQVIGR